jgi:hypothetical protein
MRKTTKRRLRWEATEGAERIVLIKEGRLLLPKKASQAGANHPRREPEAATARPR